MIDNVLSKNNISHEKISKENILNDNPSQNTVSKELKRYNYLFGETGAAYHEMYLKLGLPDSAIMILYAILENGDRRLLREICHFTGLNKQTINSAIRKLEAEGIVYLDMAGAKNKVVCLTKEGRRLAEQTAGLVLQAENEIFASWAQEDVEKYLALTEKFLQALKEKAKAIQGGKDSADYYNQP